MNKINTIILGILGGMDTVFYMATPILIAILWYSVTGKIPALLFTLALFSSIFRSIKIGFLKK